MLLVVDLFLFFKQKTAYEMRISDWSSDVCSSDLRRLFGIVVIIVVLALLSVTGFMQLAKVARFHELNALHLQAAHALYLQLDAADGTVPDPASLRALVEQVRAQPLACLRESGSFERLEIGLLGGGALLQLCERDLALADRTLAQISA